MPAVVLAHGLGRRLGGGDAQQVVQGVDHPRNGDVLALELDPDRTDAGIMQGNDLNRNLVDFGLRPPFPVRPVRQQLGLGLSSRRNGLVLGRRTSLPYFVGLGLLRRGESVFTLVNQLPEFPDLLRIPLEHQGLGRIVEDDIDVQMEIIDETLDRGERHQLEYDKVRCGRGWLRKRNSLGFAIIVVAKAGDIDQLVESGVE